MRRGFLAVLLLVAGSAGADTGLDDWLERELVPDMLVTLAEHPRFRGETMRFVVLDDDQPAAVTSELALSLRDRLQKAALDAGITGIGRASPANPGDDITTCRAADVHYHVGVSVSQFPGGSHEVSVRALDLEDGLWVTGFGDTWRGRLDASQRRAAVTRQVDPWLLGARDAPFSDTETDLLARRLADELACRLSRQTAGTYIVPVPGGDTRDGDIPPAIAAALEIAGHAVAGHPSFELTGNPERANAMLGARAHRIDGELHQVRLSVTPTGSDDALETISVSAYVTLPGFPADNWSGGETADGGTHGESRNGRTTLAASARGSLIGPVRIRPATAARDCREFTRRQHADRFPTTRIRCMTLQASPLTDAIVFVLENRPGLGLVRLGSAGCAARSRPSILRRGETLRLPLDYLPNEEVSLREPAHWFADPQSDAYIAIAVSETRLARRVADIIDRLPQRCGHAPAAGLMPQAQADWIVDFLELAEQGGDAIGWRSVEISQVL